MVKLQWWIQVGWFWLEDSINLWEFWFAWPLSWGGGWSEGLVTTAVTDPSSGAINTAMLDAYSGVIITTTTYWVDQTIWTPTNTSATKRFTVINKSTSTHAIKVNGANIWPWASKYFVWDWTSWTWNDWDLEGSDFLTPETWTRYYCPYNTTNLVTTSGNNTADRIIWIPHITQQEMVISSINTSWDSGWVASSYATIWIYESNSDGLPTNLLSTTWAVDTSAASGNIAFTVTPNLVIPVNTVVWFAFAWSSTSPVWRKIPAASIRNILWSWITSQPSSHLRTVLSPWWTDLPNPAPAVWSFSFSTWVLNFINLWLINQW